jgi:hypothetical protein
MWIRLVASVEDGKHEEGLQGCVEENAASEGDEASCARRLEPAGLIVAAVKCWATCDVCGIDCGYRAVKSSDIVGPICLDPVQILAELGVCFPCYDGDVDSDDGEACAEREVDKDVGDV